METNEQNTPQVEETKVEETKKAEPKPELKYTDADVDKMIADGALYESGPSDYEK